jgi:hypothetical protein
MVEIDRVSEMERIARLRADGHISEAEFASLKTELLSRPAGADAHRDRPSNVEQLAGATLVDDVTQVVRRAGILARPFARAR